jgi:hypothetical protein
VPFTHLHQFDERHVDLASLLEQDLGSLHPGEHQHEERACDQQRHVAAVQELEQVRRQEGDVERNQRHHHEGGFERAPAPNPTEHETGQQGRDDHRSEN